MGFLVDPEREIGGIPAWQALAASLFGGEINAMACKRIGALTDGWADRQGGMAVWRDGGTAVALPLAAPCCPSLPL